VTRSAILLVSSGKKKTATWLENQGTSVGFSVTRRESTRERGNDCSLQQQKRDHIRPNSERDLNMAQEQRQERRQVALAGGHPYLLCPFTNQPSFGRHQRREVELYLCKEAPMGKQVRPGRC